MTSRRPMTCRHNPSIQAKFAPLIGFHPLMIPWTEPLTLPGAKARRILGSPTRLPPRLPEGLCPSPLYVLGGVVVPMQAGSAVRASMPADGQALLDQDATARAGLAGVGRRHGYDSTAQRMLLWLRGWSGIGSTPRRGCFWRGDDSSPGWPPAHLRDRSCRWSGPAKRNLVVEVLALARTF